MTTFTSGSLTRGKHPELIQLGKYYCPVCMENCRGITDLVFHGSWDGKWHCLSCGRIMWEAFLDEVDSL